MEGQYILMYLLMILYFGTLTPPPLLHGKGKAKHDFEDLVKKEEKVMEVLYLYTFSNGGSVHFYI